jgi:hypothetical protein
LFINLKILPKLGKETLISAFLTTVLYGAVPMYVDSLLGKGIHRERDQKIWPNPAPKGAFNNYLNKKRGSVESPKEGGGVT